MARDKYLFKDSSRIYKQAYDLAFVLRSSINGTTEWFSELVQELETRGLNVRHDDSQWLQAVDFARQRVNTIASSNDSRIEIPSLFQAVDDFFHHHQSWNYEVPIADSAMRFSIAMIWPNRSVQTEINKSSEYLIRLVSAVVAWEQSTGGYECYKVFEFGHLIFRFNQLGDRQPKFKRSSAPTPPKNIHFRRDEQRWPRRRVDDTYIISKIKNGPVELDRQKLRRRVGRLQLNYIGSRKIPWGKV